MIKEVVEGFNLRVDPTGYADTVDLGYKRWKKCQKDSFGKSVEQKGAI
jgi:hypothetical protein